MSKKEVVIAGRDNFKEVCEQVLPHLTAIEEIMKKKGITESASITVGVDGYLSYRIYGSNWEMNRYDSDGRVTIRNEYREEITLPDAPKKE